jgi:RNA polymerase sigma-70 factor (ECF subfamily)
MNDSPPLDDDLALARSGDPAALGRLLLQYGDYLHILARLQISRRLQGKVDAADLVQDVFLDAHRQFPNFRGETRASFGAWLRSILAGKLAALIRRYCHALSRDVTLEQSLERELESSSDQLRQGMTGGHSPSESAVRREEVSHLARALEALPPDYREVILLRQIEGLPFATVAEKMGRSEDSVQKLWVRGLDALRKILDSPRTAADSARPGDS